MEPLEIIIETPKGSTEKYSYDEQRKCFKLKKILPSGMAFPYDFGFIPGTKGDDGDPLDIILISEFKSFPGCVMDVRVVGAILAEQSAHKGSNKKIRNDRYIAVPALSTVFSDIQSVDDLPKGSIEQLVDFFINYNAVQGKKFKPLKILQPKPAWKLLNENKNG